MISRIKGFTLIELLIVIALIGALIVGLLAAIDPVEQIRRGQDTGVRGTAAELTNALNRYFTNRGQYPWGTTAQTSAVVPAASITALVTAGELKSNFPSNAATNLTKIFVTEVAGTGVTACFLPTSKALKTDATAVYTQAGAVATPACTPGPTNTCYICVN